MCNYVQYALKHITNTLFLLLFNFYIKCTRSFLSQSVASGMYTCIVSHNVLSLQKHA